MLPPHRRRAYLHRLQPLRLALEGGHVARAQAELEAWNDPLARAQAFHGTLNVDAAMQRLLDQYSGRQHELGHQLNFAAAQGRTADACWLVKQGLPISTVDSALATALANGKEQTAWGLLPHASRLSAGSALISAIHAGQSSPPSTPRPSGRLILYLVDTLPPDERRRRLPDLMGRAIRARRLDVLPRLLRRWKRVAHRVVGARLVEEMLAQEALIQDNFGLAQRLVKFFKLDLVDWVDRRQVDGISPTPEAEMRRLEQWQYAVQRAQHATVLGPTRTVARRPRC